MKILIAALMLASYTASAEPAASYPEGWVCSPEWLADHPDGGDIVCQNSARPRG